MRTGKQALFIVASTLGLTVLVFGSFPEPANADTPGCVTKREFHRAKDGMRKARVHRIFDTAGKQTSWYNIGGDVYETREYRACKNPSWSHVSVDYVNKRVDGKFAYWG